VCTEWEHVHSKGSVRRGKRSGVCGRVRVESKQRRNGSAGIDLLIFSGKGGVAFAYLNSVRWVLPSNSAASLTALASSISLPSSLQGGEKREKGKGAVRKSG